MSLLQKIEGFVQSGEKDIGEAARFVVNEVLPELKIIAGDAPIIQQIAALAGPDASRVTSIVLNLVTWAINTVQAGEQAVAAGGLNVTLDQELVQQIESIISILKLPPKSTTPAA